MHAKPHTQQIDDSALFSARFLRRLTIVIAALASLVITISLGGRTLGEYIALAGHTESRERYEILIGQDHVRLPANAIRFEEQRRSGPADRVDVYLTWPEMEGYSNATRLRFNDVERPESLLFLQLSQSTMSRDMSGRIEPIFSHLFEGELEAGPAGLSLRRLRQSAGYENEALLLGTMPDGRAYAVRCILPAPGQMSTSADCQRDIHIGDDLSLLYRFSNRLLPQWQAIEEAIWDFAQTAVAENRDHLSGKSRR
ncbi:hypothetical protein IB238_07585 [Rhizobium sp. ARZ01]|uniref:hypothetical protein n=1 Tax=Rhizobium sp. ARZ01 TaxID=2769313 RepID=UPI00177AE263|nr:hypothetical protein [Rhizobium sp. ARZ01]MBD9372479.1 hypothetical protein [Rhizobium sp. ARZ01]